MYFHKIFFIALFLVIAIPFTAFSQEELQYGPEHYEDFDGTYTELVLVYIGADACGPCHRPEVKEKIEEYKLALLETAKNQGKSFSAVGVANDYSIEKGWNFLQSSGYFDEVIIGKNWKNNGSIEFMFKHEDIMSAMPTVVIYEREIQHKKTDILFSEPTIIAHTLVMPVYEWNEENMSFIRNDQ